MGGAKGGMRGRVFRNKYKGHTNKAKEGWKQGREVGMAGVGRRGVEAGVKADNCN